MTKIKMCGLTRPEDIKAANAVMPDYIGFVFAGGSRRYISPEKAAELRKTLAPCIKAAGVFVNEKPENIAELLRRGVIDIAQLHGGEDEEYIKALRRITDAPIIKAFRIKTESDAAAAKSCTADAVLLDSGGGTGSIFDWALIRGVKRPYFLAGGLDPDNAARAIRLLHPYALDVSSGIETDGHKDERKMAAFAAAVRKEDGK